MDNLDTSGGMSAGLKGLIGVVIVAAIVVGGIATALLVIINPL